MKLAHRGVLTSVDRKHDPSLELWLARQRARFSAQCAGVVRRHARRQAAYALGKETFRVETRGHRQPWHRGTADQHRDEAEREVDP